MSDYTRIYNLTVKDSLPSGNSGKVIKGTELDAELNAVAAAIASKADSNSPTFTGTPVAPTASVATHTTQIATTAYVYAERTNTATLTNKTLTSPTINTPTIATPAISSATVTGSITMASDDTGIVKGSASVKVDGTHSEVVLATLSGSAVLNSAGKLTNAGIVESTTGGFKFPDATTQTTAVTAYPGPGGQVFTANGTFTIPAGTTKVKVTVTGGGGNGAYTGGGGGGGTAIKWLSNLTPGRTLAVTVGASNTDSTVKTGTTGTPQTITTLTGSAGGNASGQTGGTGGTATNGDLNIQGNGGVGPSGVVNDSGTREGGAGGGSYWGGGARGANGNGVNGGNYGGGGSGYGYGSSTAGTGAAGVVVFEW